MYAKTIWNNQIHMLSLKQVSTVDELKILIRKVFKNIPTDFVLKVDNGDELVELSQNEAIIQFRQKNVKKIKLMIQQSSVQPKQQVIQDKTIENKQQERVIQFEEKIDEQLKNVKLQNEENNQPENIQQNSNIKQQQINKQLVYQCRLCSASPVVGVIYRCSVCSNLNICENCEFNYEHQHPLVKLKNQNQRKFKIFAVLQSELPEIIHRDQSKENVAQANNEEIALDGNEQKKQGVQHKNQKTQPLKVIASSAHWILNKLSQFKRYYMGQFCNPENVIEDQQIPKKQEKQMSQIQLKQKRQDLEHNWGEIEASDEQNEASKPDQIQKM